MDQQFKELVKDAKTDIRELDPEQVYEEMQQRDALEIIDVRENEEREKAAIPRSRHLNRGIVERDIDEIVEDKDQDIILYCGGGGRSALAAKNLKEMGYQNVYSLKGGFSKWKKQELPVDS